MYGVCEILAPVPIPCFPINYNLTYYTLWTFTPLYTSRLYRIYGVSLTPSLISYKLQVIFYLIPLILLCSYYEQMGLIDDAWGVIKFTMRWRRHWQVSLAALSHLELWTPMLSPRGWFPSRDAFHDDVPLELCAKVTDHVVDTGRSVGVGLTSCECLTKVGGRLPATRRL